jgi:hypothetical protein
VFVVQETLINKRKKINNAMPNHKISSSLIWRWFVLLKEKTLLCNYFFKMLKTHLKKKKLHWKT